MDPIIIILFLSFFQNIAYSLSSRSRNRDNMGYHAICAGFSNGIWFTTMHFLIVSDLTFWLIIPYIFGTVCGSVFGARISMKIESMIGSKT